MLFLLSCHTTKNFYFDREDGNRLLRIADSQDIDNDLRNGSIVVLFSRDISLLKDVSFTLCMERFYSTVLINVSFCIRYAL
jgi:hypothetical protein